MILFEDDTVVLTYEKDVPCLTGLFKEETSSESYRTMLHRIQEFVKTNNDLFKGLGFVSDTRFWGNIAQDDFEYTGKLIPSWVDAGLTHEALIVPNVEYEELEDKEATYLISGLEVKKFDSIEAGKKWLKESIA